MPYLVVFLGIALGIPLWTSRAWSEPSSDWSTYGADLGNQRHSNLQQITPATVGRLEVAWRIRTGIPKTFQATPIVQGGTAYVSTPTNHVLALDAATGTLRWRYEHVSRWKETCCGPANRGVAVGGGLVFMGTTDARLIALHQESGELAWDLDLALATPSAVPVEKVAPGDLAESAEVTGNTGITANSAPLYWNGRVYQGISGVGYGVHLADGSVHGISRMGGNRGFLVAADAKTGVELWRWHSIRSDGWTGPFTPTTAWGEKLGRDAAAERRAAADHPDSWQTGGASVWNTPALDPERKLLFVGTGNPSPQMADDLRPGDNLDSVSLVALDAETGARRWAYQYVPHDLWGYDAASPALLFDFPGSEGPRAAVGHASKNGLFFAHDRETGALLMPPSPFVPTENRFGPIGTEPTIIAPGAAGGANWNPPAIDPQRGIVVIPALHLPFEYVRRPGEAGRADVVIGRPATDRDSHGLLTALELGTGQVRWQQRRAEPTFGGVLSTASGLVFVSGGDGSLRALATNTGETLWSFQADAGLSAPPITYSAGGRQFLLIVAGGNQLFGTKPGDEILAFSLPLDAH
jgi:PQQ-dependent dehydrogenase (methanol/ethanol family)